MADVGAILRAERERRGLTLRGVGATIGCSHVYLGEMETGRRPISARLLPALARLYELDPDALRRRPSRAVLAYLARHPEVLAALEREAEEEGPACGGLVGMRREGTARAARGGAP